MSTYQVQDLQGNPIIVDTAAAVEKWEDRWTDGTAWHCHTLFRTKDYWFVELKSNYVPTHPDARYCSPEDAVEWFLDHHIRPIPPELHQVKENLLEKWSTQRDDDDQG